jgi:mannose-6-phosphate isomerase-like protein (cupin superfamily)
MTMIPWKSSKRAIEAVLTTLPRNEQFHYPIRHGSMRVGLYSPQDVDDQTPHTQDELYIIASGSGWFVKGTQRVPCEPQDVLFVEAGVAHRFENFSDDFSAWVIFWGPQGGEENRDGEIGE